MLIVQLKGSSGQIADQEKIYATIKWVSVVNPYSQWIKVNLSV